ncbi:DUF4097 family beta strand repeat-containing protein [Marinoscillum sp.]|uniref:DUF4097 family beta strand repeat-containing protein n=1 Tax=Marinoscillum sp. TaxID=2024838 RepID=UPI003BAD3EE0
MKISLITLIILCSLLCKAQVKEVQLQDRLPIAPDRPVTVVVDNVFGGIEVTATNAPAVSYQVLKTINADHAKALEKGLTEVNMKIIQRNDSIIFYLTAPFICDQWSGCYQRGRWMDGPEDYDFNFDYQLQIPANANLKVQTVDQGKVTIKGITGTVSAGNVNGDVEISGAHAVARATTVNGDVEVTFQKRPNLDGRFSTINGTINLYCTSDLSASVTAKTMHGSLFSAFDFETKKPELKKVVSKKGASTTYQLNETFGIEIGKNGPTLSFETLNGDIYLRKL